MRNKKQERWQESRYLYHPFYFLSCSKTEIKRIIPAEDKHCYFKVLVRSLLYWQRALLSHLNLKKHIIKEI